MAIRRDYLALDDPPAYSDDENYDTIDFDFMKGCEKRISINIKSDFDLQYEDKPLYACNNEPTLVILVDPHNVECNCGQLHDTTTGSDDLPAGLVRCNCGNLVSSAGWSRWEPRTIACPTATCFTLIPWPQKKRFICNCGIGLDTDASVCIPALGWKRDLTKVRCRCGRYVDTTGRCTVSHEDLTRYEYALPEGSARCECGCTVRADGTSVDEHPVNCCSVKYLSASIHSE